jgi:hypothetical protein
MIALGLLQSTPNNSLKVLSGVSPLTERCLFLNYRFLVSVFHKHGYPLRERLENPEKVGLRKIHEGICTGDPVHFLTIKNLCTI